MEFKRNTDVARFNWHTSRDQYEKLRQLAFIKGENMSETLRFIFDRYIRTYQGEENYERA